MIFPIALAVLVIATALANNKINKNQTENLAPYGFLIGLSGSLLAVVLISAWLVKKIPHETHRKKFFNATLIGLAASIVLWVIINASLSTV